MINNFLKTITMTSLSKKIQKEVRSATGGVVINSKIFKNFYLPLIQYYINDRKKKKIKTYIIGIQGGQGSGKTVLTALIKSYLKSKGYSAAAFSIDDFYKSNIEQKKFFKQQQKNPFYKTRGLPGTHKFNKLYGALKAAESGRRFIIPRFNKSLHGGEGDISRQTTPINSRQDFIILEGWCVNIPLVEPEKFPLVMASNKYADKIFKGLDPKKKHYKAVLNYIKKYQKIWKLLNNKTILLGKNIKWIEQWRIEQEKRMIARKKKGMTNKKIKEFIKPYIPFTYLFYDRAAKNKKDINCLLTIKKNHLPEKIEFFH